ncbi:MAG: ABC transporter ATP-binding protein [Planctomycetota bacterium]|jgi:lipopolysaccharide transport system ATP-binding protein
MASDSVIHVDELGKRYRLGEAGPYRTLREAIRRWVAAPARRLLGRGKAPSGQADRREIWALRNVSFEVGQGEVLGVIGRNGAGKSTLLKILTRITRPTEGRAEIVGRVGSLLEVGTGFHPELTGRENVFLSGAVLGMTRAEIRRKFDQIADFSGVEPFLDTPVKRYSSGMQVRLAFAVAAHLEPEILLVDEVLAVGDAEFQRKCLGKMGDVAKGGRTILFVSHNMAAVQNLCTQAILLHQGGIAFSGDVTETIETYLGSLFQSEPGFAEIAEHPGRPHDMTPIARFVGLRGEGESDYQRVVSTGDDVIVEIGYDTGDHVVDLVQLGISTVTGQRVTTVGTHLSRSADVRLQGRGVIQCRLPAIRLSGGEYTLTVMLGRRTPPMNYDYVEEALQFTVKESDYFGTGGRLLPGQGFLVQESRWQVKE